MRREGVGRALIEAAEAWARSMGCRRMASDAELWNIISHQAHGALGYEETGRLVPFKQGPGTMSEEPDRRDILGHNRHAWDRQVEQGNHWTVPVNPEEVARALRGDWTIVLTPTRPVPSDWFPPLAGLEVLCLASGCGQHGPILAAAGAKVTMFDNSPGQLAQDRLVAEREGLEIETGLGDMADLSVFPEARFDLIFHPVSNVFAPDVRSVWREAFRVLRPGDSLLSGFMNPVQYLFDDIALERGELRVAHRIPYSDIASLTDEVRARLAGQVRSMEFGHTLGDQIGGQIAAGFLLAGFYEDIDPESVLGDFIPSYIATRALKPSP